MAEKLAAQRALALRHTHSPAEATNGVTNPDCRQTFFKQIKDAAGITKKELVFVMRISDTIVDRWTSGEQDDPFERAAKAVGMLLKKGREDLASLALKRIAGGAEFPGLILDGEEAAGLRKASGAVK